jgi:hypothetical protein
MVFPLPRETTARLRKSTASSEFRFRTVRVGVGVAGVPPPPQELPVVGDVLGITGIGAGGWKIAQNAGQTIQTSFLAGGQISVSSFEAHQSRVHRHVGVLSPAPHLFARVPKHACEDIQKRRIELPARLKLEISKRCGPSNS